ncbi:MAG TPA: winged helix-turn-helix domain-containing protein [Roseovarius sp.]
MDLISRTLCRSSDNTPIGVTSTEYALLLALTDRPGNVLTRPEILDALYGNSTAVTDRAIDAHIARLRHKLAEGNGDMSLIRTVHGVGYKIAVNTVTAH